MKPQMVGASILLRSTCDGNDRDIQGYKLNAMGCREAPEKPLGGVQIAKELILSPI